MDLSIRDLIVPNDRPDAASRGNASQTAFSGTSSASISAFNDLLRQFSTEADTRQTTTSREHAATSGRASDRNSDAPGDDKVRENKPAAEDAAHADRSQATGDARKASDQTRAQGEEMNQATGVNVADANPQDARGPGDAPEPDLPVNPLQPLAQAKDNPAVSVKSDPVAALQPENTGKTITGETGTSLKTSEAPANQSNETNGTQLVNAAATSKGRPAQLNNFSGASLEAFSENLDTQDDGVNDEIANLVRDAMARGNNSAVASDVGKRQPIDTKLSGADQTRQTSISVPQNDGADSGKSLRPMPGYGVLLAQEVGSNGAMEVKSGLNGATTAGTDSSAGQNGNGPNAAQGGGQTVGSAEMQTLGIGAAGISTAEQTQSAPRQILGNGIQILSSPPGIQAASNGIVKMSGAAQSAARAQSPAPVPFEDVAVHIARAASTGSDHITIKLKPAALGQIDVKLDLTQDGRVTAVITADRSDTLDMLARDAKSLERALADAGLKTDSGSLQFNLRGDGNAYGEHEQANARYPSLGETPDVELNDPSKVLALSNYINPRLANGGVDIRV